MTRQEVHKGELSSIEGFNNLTLSRRALVTRSITLAVGASALASMLAACADEDDGETAEADDDSDTQPAAQADDDESTEEHVEEDSEEDAEPVEEPDEADDPADDGEGDDEIVRGGTIVVSSPNDWEGLDPHRQSQTSPAFHQVYNCLTRLEPQDDDSIEVTPELATSWELAEDHAVFHLREGVTFHDGSDWNAEVCAFNIERLQDDQSYGRAYVETITSVDIEDDYVARFNLSAPTGSLLANMSTSAHGFTFMVSKEMAEEAGDQYGRAPELTAGTGPMRVVEWVSGSHDIVERTGEYWELGVDGEPLPYFETQRSQFNSDESVRALEVRSGDADIARQIHARDVDALNNADGVDVVENVFQHTAHQFTFSAEHGLFHDDLDLRKAVQYAINREALADVLGSGYGSPMYWFLPVGLLGYDESIPYYDYDPDLAIEHMEAAGYSDGLEFEITLINRELDIQQGEMLQQMFEEVGMTVHLDVLERLAWIEKAESGQFDFATYNTGVRPDPDGLIGARWGCASGQNYGQLCEDELEELLAAGRSTYDEDERAESYRQAQVWMFENAWYGAMWYRPWFDAVRDRVQNRTRTFESELNLRHAWVADGQ